MGPKAFVFLVVDMLVKAPFFGWFVAWRGNIMGASAASMKRLMEKGTNLGLIPGGFEEASTQEFGVERVMVKQRKGFIKYALRYGYRVHPVYSFGECDTFATFTGFRRLRMWLNKFKIPTVVFWGAWLMPLLPSSSAEVHTVVGPGIQFPKLEGDALTAEEVNKWHATYVAALVELFDKHKAQVGKGHLKLQVA
jgi:2-acylglycerol O-acyltransferase 2